MMGRTLLTALAFAALLLGSLPASGQDNSLTRRTLKDLPGVHLEVATFREHAKRAGFSHSIFETSIASKLRDSGIKVLTPQQTNELIRKPNLYIRVSPGSDTDCFVMDIWLQQMVALLVEGDPVFSYATTWSIQHYGRGAPEAVRSSLLDTPLETFINAWLSVNPKE